MGGERQEPTTIQRAAREAAHRTASEQGLPVKVTDLRAVEQVAVILRAGTAAHEEVWH